MKTVLVIATILAVVLAEGFQETEGVIQLTETNFEDGLKLSPFVFVKFYAPCMALLIPHPPPLTNRICIMTVGQLAFPAPHFSLLKSLDCLRKLRPSEQ